MFHVVGKPPRMAWAARLASEGPLRIEGGARLPSPTSLRGSGTDLCSCPHTCLPLVTQGRPAGLALSDALLDRAPTGQPPVQRPGPGQDPAPSNQRPIWLLA